MLMRFSYITLAAILLAGCSSSPEEKVQRAAERMNALKNPALDSARAEGRLLIVRYKPLGLQQFSDSELTKLTTAGLCAIDGVKGLLDDGGSIRLELPRRGDYLGIEIERCDGAKAVAKAPAPAAPAAPAAGASPAPSGEWPTAAPITR